MSGNAEVRPVLIGAARLEFARYRYVDASLNRVLRRCGLSKGAFYHYFEGKEHLYLAVMQEVHALILAPWRAIDLQKAHRASYWSAIRRAIGLAAQACCEHEVDRRLWKHFHRDYREFGDSLAMLQLVQRARHVLDDILARGQEIGLVRTDMERHCIITLFEAAGRLSDELFFNELETGADFDEALEGHLERTVDLLRRLVRP